MSDVGTFTTLGHEIALTKHPECNKVIWPSFHIWCLASHILLGHIHNLLSWSCFKTAVSMSHHSDCCFVVHRLRKLFLSSTQNHKWLSWHFHSVLYHFLFFPIWCVMQCLHVLKSQYGDWNLSMLYWEVSMGLKSQYSPRPGYCRPDFEGSFLNLFWRCSDHCRTQICLQSGEKLSQLSE